jgi:hypothetical protein
LWPSPYVAWLCGDKRVTAIVAPPLPLDTTTEVISPPVAVVVDGEPEYCTPLTVKV